MENKSFRAILEQLLEAKNAPIQEPVAEPIALFSPPLYDFWQGPKLTRKSNGYPPPPKKPAAAVMAEKVFARAELSTIDQAHLEMMIRIGGLELEKGLSRSLLRKAHRRLVKMFHPDNAPTTLNAMERAARQERFLLLQTSYEALALFLKTNGSARGNESASARDSRRQDAA